MTDARSGFVPGPPGETAPTLVAEVPPPPPSALVAVIDAAHLAGALRDLAAACAARVDLQVGGASPRVWPSAGGLVLLDAAAAARLSRAGRLPAAGTRLVLVGDRDDPDLDEVAAAVGATRVARLPHAQAWLLTCLAEASEPSSRPATVIAVRGCLPTVTAVDSGAVAAGLALTVAGSMATAARPRHDADGSTGLPSVRAACLALDADLASPGLDLRLAAEAVPGARWADLAGARGRLPVGFLPAHLPRLGALSVLAPGLRPGAGVPPETAEAVLAAAWRSFSVVVADVGASDSPLATAVLDRADHLVLVVPPGVTALAGARRFLAGLAATGPLPPVHAVVLTVRGWPARLSVEVLGDAPLAPASWVPLRVGPGARRAALDAVPPLARAGSRLGRACADVLAAITGSAGGSGGVA